MNKLKINNTAIMFYVQIDSQERLDNIHYILNFYNKNLDIPIWIIETGNNPQVQHANYNCNYMFVKTDANYPIEKNKYTNIIYNIIPEPIIMYCDADILVSPESIQKASQMINDGNYNFIWPCHTIFYLDARKNDDTTYDITLIHQELTQKQFTWLVEPPCAAFMFNKIAYRKYGFDNAKFIAAYHEDTERVFRLLRNGFPRIFVKDGYGYHLDHPRPKNNSWLNDELVTKNCLLSEYTRSIPEIKLPKYISELKSLNDEPENLYNILNCPIKTSSESARWLHKYLTQFKYNIESIIDVGCGKGTYLLPFIGDNIEIFGIDMKYYDEKIFIPNNCFNAFDFRKPYTVTMKYDAALCIGIADYFPSNCTEQLVKLLTSLSDLIIFSPQISSPGFLNYNDENTEEYWNNLFNKNNFILDNSDIKSFTQSYDFHHSIKNSILLYKKL
jgi:hypothetical protein